MKKEPIIAIVLGVGLGVIFSFIVLSKTKERQLDRTKTMSQEKKAVTVVPKTESIQLLTIEELQNNLIVDKNKITIKGKALKNSLIVIQSPTRDITLNNKEEDFSVDFPLSMGENLIQITVYPKDTSIRSQQKEYRIYYLTD